MRSLLPAALLTAAALPLFAVSTVFWRSAGYQDFSRGRMSGLSLSQEGRLSVAPAMQAVFYSDQALIWTMTSDAQGNIYLATGHRGKVYRLTPAMLKSASSGGPPITADQALLFTASEAEVFALAIGPDGALYAGTSPDGKVYRIAADGSNSVYFDPKSKYIWSLAFSGSNLFVGTGENGDIYRVTAAGQGDLFLDTKQRQVMTLASDAKGDLYAGTEPGGMVFRIHPDGQAFVLYHSDLAEIHQLSIAPGGDVYVAAQGTNSRLRLPSAAAPTRTAGGGGASGMTVTVVSNAEQQNPVPTGAQRSEPEPPPVVVSDSSEAAPANGAVLSAIYHITPAGAVDTLWSSRQESADDVLLDATHGLLVATDANGRIYDLDQHRQTTVLVQTQQEEATKLMRLGDAIYATTRDFGNLYRIGTQPAAQGSFESPVRDTHAISRWGDIRWRGEAATTAGIELFTRSGNSSTPDFTWSQWSPAYTKSGSPITSPSARYVQWRAVIHSQDGASPDLDEVVIPYLPANQAPEITSFRAQSGGGTAAGAEDGEGNGLEQGGRGRGGDAAVRGIRLTWTAHDPDGDTLRYSLSFRGEGQTSWTPLRNDLTASQFVVTPQMLPDGVYQFRLEASDADANPSDQAKTAEMISAPATLNTAPPAIQVVSTEAPAAGVGVAHFSAQDKAAALNSAEYSVDGGDWKSLYSDDGIIDSPAEQFTVRMSGLVAGEHVFLLRVADEAGNQSLAKAVILVR